jgi:hypothetical protein
MEEVQVSRSQKRLIKDIAKLSERRERLLDKGKLSLPSGEGLLAIIVSRVPDYHSELSPREQHKAFLEEAERIGQERSKDHHAVAVRPMPATASMRMDFADPEITDIILIGHGSIGCLWVDGGRYFDWHMAAKAAHTLKQGRIEQRMCGNLPPKTGKTRDMKAESIPHKYSVALGTFAVSNLGNVLAAAGREVSEINPPDELFQPIYTSHGTAPEEIEAFNQMYGEQPTIRVT